MLRYMLTLLLFPMTAFGNTIGSDHQNFNQGLSYTDYLTVHSGQTLGKGVFSFGLGLNHGVNTLPYFGEDNSDSTVDDNREYNDGISGMDVNIAFGILDNLDLSLAIPYVVHQELTEEDEFHGEFDRLGNTEVRGALKYRFLTRETFNLALVGVMNRNRTENNPYTGEEEWPAYSMELVGEFISGPWSLSANFGHRWRNSGEAIAFDNDTPIQPYENQWLYSGAVKYTFEDSALSAIAEIYGNYTEDDITLVSPRNASVAEGIAGLRYQVNPDLFVQAGGGGELRHAVSSADQRYFVGMHWKIGGAKEAAAPAPEPARAKAYRLPVSFEIEDIQFAFDKSDIRYETERAKLEAVKQVLEQESGNIARVIVEGHACRIGTDKYNLGLSDRRANTVLDWMLAETKVRQTT